MGLKLDNERRALVAIVGIYRRGKHGGSGEGLCGDCAELLEYSLKRLESCTFGEGKPVCSKCSVHC